jgi:hypothetical protein
VLYHMEGVGIRAYRTSSSPTTIAIKRVGRWYHSRCYMVIGVEPRYFGMRWKGVKFWTQHIARSREASSYGREKTCGFHSQDKSYADHR